MKLLTHIQHVVRPFLLPAILLLVSVLLSSSSSTSSSAASYSLFSFDRMPPSSFHTVAKKRSNMDLAFIQMYQLCDHDRNGIFSQLELQCLSHMLRLLISGRNK